MNVISHDPSEHIRGLQQLLVSDKKKIAFLFGAGTSLAKKNKDSLNVPAIGKMTQDITDDICKDPKIKNAIDEIKNELNDKYNIETLLSNIEQKKQLICNGTLNGLNLSEFEYLLACIKIKIQEIVSIHKEIIKQNNIFNVLHIDFAEWVDRADRKYPIEIFTTNYDYLFELGLEAKNVPYYDGFTGSYQPFFNPDSIEEMNFLPNQTKLWKIHGSLGWHFNTENKKVWRKDSDNDDILIYPSTLKYADSKKQPYTSLLDRLTNFLKEPDTILITCGYSFGDEHINERILTAINSNSSTHVYALLFDKIYEAGKRHYTLTEKSSLAKIAMVNRKLSVYGNRYAIIGCQYGKWKLKKQPDKADTINISLYFDEDANFNSADEIGKEEKGTETWTGDGELILPDFKKFVEFLNYMRYNNESINELKL